MHVYGVSSVIPPSSAICPSSAIQDKDQLFLGFMPRMTGNLQEDHAGKTDELTGVSAF